MQDDGSSDSSGSEIELDNEFSLPLGPPTGYIDFDAIEQTSVNKSISSTNKGFQLMLKMGWQTGNGLGVRAQGRVDPIPMTSNQFALGLGKGAEIEQAQEESTAKRKVLGSERLADETDLEQQRRMEIANKMESVKEEVKSVLSSFYCDICDKQYAKVAEFDVHLSSYDHNHRKRLKELKETTKVLIGSSSKKKDDREKVREEKELKRMQIAAAAAQQKHQTPPEPHSSSATTATSAAPPKEVKMSFTLNKSGATYLQNELMTLSNEARRKNPEIKDAAERLSYILRALKEKSSAAPANVGSAAGPAVDVIAQELAKSEDVLRPFILSLETKNPKLTPIAVGCLQRLISHHAVPETSIPLVLRSLDTVSNSSMEMQLKILQTVLPLLTNYKIVHNELLAEALYLCFRLQESKTAVVNNTAAATLRQLVTHVFEKLVMEDSELGAPAYDNFNANSLNPCGKDAYLLFLDLCKLTNGEDPDFLVKVQNVTKGFGLELIESVLTNHHKLFKSHPELLRLLKDRVCPLVIRSFSDKNDFPLTIRLMRVVQIIIIHFHGVLNMEGEIFLSLLGKLVEPDHAPLWQRIVVMEIYRDVCSDHQLLRSIFRLYDSKDHSTKIFQDMISAISRIIVSEKSHLLFINTSPSNSDSQGPNGAMADQYALTASASVKMQCIDQLDKGEPPQFPETYILYLAIMSIMNMIESTADYILPLFNSSKENSKFQSEAEKEELLLAIEMPKSSWSYVLAVLSFLVNASIDEELFGNVIKSFQSFTSTVGILGLNSQRDAFLGGLCKACVPNPSSGFSVDTNPQILSTSINFRTAPILLHERNVVSLKALLSVAQKLTPVLEEKAWYLILDTLQIADGLVSLGKMGRKDNSSMQLGAELLKDGRQRANTFTQPPLGGGGGGLDNLFVSVQSSIKKFFETSKTMEDASFHEFTKALCRMAKEFCTSPNNLNISKDSMKVADEKSFAIARIHDLAVLNVNRLILSKPMWVATATPTVPFQVWDVIVGQLVDIAHHPNCPPSIRSQLCLAMSEVLTAAIQNGDLTDSTVEQNILAPLRNLMVGNNSISGGGGGVDDDEKDDSNIDVTRLPWFLDVQKSGLEILYRLLQAAGQNIKLGWGLIFSVVRTVVGGGAKARRQAGMEAKALSDAGFINPSDSGVGDPAANSANVAKYASLVRVAFPCLQLICTDFLSLLNPAMLYECIETLSCFGFQADDLNISLTSIGLLWSVSDFVLTNRQKMEKEEADKSEGDLTASVSARAVSTSRTFIKSPSVDRLLEEGLTKKSLDTLWMFLLSNFSQLCSDQRPEVRNSANQTLFRTIGMNGQRLTIDAWEECIWNVLFPLLDRVKTSSELAEDRERMESPMKDKPGTPASKPASVMVHHSRNTAAKQWDETKVLTLNGITKSFIDFLPVLVDLSDFQKAWQLFLNFIRDWCLDGSPEVSMAAIKSLKTLIRYPKDLAEGQQLSENIATKILDLWEDAWNTWAGIGLGVIMKADEHKDSVDMNENSLSLLPRQSPSIFHGSVTQETLTVYINLFGDLFEIVRPNFGSPELRRLFLILSMLPLYHTNPLPAANGRRMDFVNDTDNLTALQLAILELAAGSSVPLKFADETSASKVIDFLHIQGAQEAILSAVASFTRAPFARNFVSSTEKGFTYIALAKKSMQTLASFFQVHKSRKEIYSSGVYAEILLYLGSAMKEKYDCPAVGQKDSTPLWKSSATSFMTVVKGGLEVIDANFASELSEDILNAIYQNILNVFEAFLLPKSRPPTSLSSEELSADEAFDISVLTAIQSDLVIHLGQSHVLEDCLKRLVSIISTGSRMYSLHLDQTHSPESPLPNGDVPRLSAVENFKIRGGVGLDVQVDVPASYTLGSDIIYHGREDFARSCFAFLFDLCSGIVIDEEVVRIRIARVVAPMLLEKCQKVISSFNNDRPLFGKCPLPRIRNEELLFILYKLESFSLRRSVLCDPDSPETHAVRAHLFSGPCAILFALYPSLCDLLCVVAKMGISNVGGEGDEERIVKTVRACLARLSEEFGLKY